MRLTPCSLLPAPCCPVAVTAYLLFLLLIITYPISVPATAKAATRATVGKATAQ